jgi:dTDP-4-amino-4,6-dideoxygalactose transaminase
MKVSRYNYAAQFDGDLPKIMQQIESLLLSGRYILSAEVERFEQEFAEYLGVPYVRAVNSGTDALILALLACGIGPGDEVITQANTFHATVAAICLVGATPILVDADNDSYLMDLNEVEVRVTRRTRAVIPVHLYGKPTDLRPLASLAAKRGLHIIEDAAQAHGARIAGRRVGTTGIAAAFSFHPSKNMAAAGDGGAIATSDRAIADDITMRRALGQRSQNEHVMVGYNSKLDSIQALILSHKLRHLDHWNAQRRDVANMYRRRLADLPVSFQRQDDSEEHVYHLFQLRTNRRDELLSFLVAAGIDCVIRYPAPIHLQPAFGKYGWAPGQFPVAESLARELLCLPIRPDMKVEEVDYVVDHVHRFFSSRL